MHAWLRLGWAHFGVEGWAGLENTSFNGYLRGAANLCTIK